MALFVGHVLKACSLASSIDEGLWLQATESLFTGFKYWRRLVTAGYRKLVHWLQVSTKACDCRLTFIWAHIHDHMLFGTLKLAACSRTSISPYTHWLRQLSLHSNWLQSQLWLQCILEWPPPTTPLRFRCLLELGNCTKSCKYGVWKSWNQLKVCKLPKVNKQCLVQLTTIHYRLYIHKMT